MELNPGQIAQLTAVRDMITTFLGPPAGQQPQDMENAGVAYVVSHLAVTPAEFDKAAGANFASGAIVSRNTEISPSQGAPIYEGIPIGQATFDAPDDAMLNPRAWKGTSSESVLRKAISQNNDPNGKLNGIAEVWIWDRNGNVSNAKTGLVIGSDASKAPIEQVLVSGATGGVLVGQQK